MATAVSALFREKAAYRLSSATSDSLGIVVFRRSDGVRR